MFRFVFYRNSILASICSIFGSACAAMAVMGLLGNEIGILPAIGMIAVGIALIWLGGVISDRKEQKKQAKAAQAANSAAANTGSAQPRYSAVQAAPAASASRTNAKRVTKSPTAATVFFSLAAAFGSITCALCITCMSRHISTLRYMLLDLGAMALLSFIEAAMCILMLIAACRTKRLQEVSACHIPALLILTITKSLITLVLYRKFGFNSFSTSYKYYNAMTLASLLEAVAYLLMTILAFFTRKNAKKHVGILVRIFWLLPILLLAITCAKNISDAHVPYSLQMFLKQGGLMYHPELTNVCAQFFMVLGMFFTAFYFRGICKKAPAIEQTTYVRPEPQNAAPQYTAPQSAPQSTPQSAPQSTPQSTPHYAAPSQPDNQEIEKKLKAYKDLLDCGILTPDEYEQKLRELPH